MVDHRQLGAKWLEVTRIKLSLKHKNHQTRSNDSALVARTFAASCGIDWDANFGLSLCVLSAHEHREESQCNSGCEQR